MKRHDYKVKKIMAITIDYFLTVTVVGVIIQYLVFKPGYSIGNRVTRTALINKNNMAVDFKTLLVHLFYASIMYSFTALILYIVDIALIISGSETIINKMAKTKIIKQ